MLIHFSIGYLIDETDVEIAATRPPLFEVALELHEPELVFVPSLGKESGFMDLILTTQEEIFGVGKLIPRIAKHKDFPDYEASFGFFHEKIPWNLFICLFILNSTKQGVAVI